MHVCMQLKAKGHSHLLLLPKACTLYILNFMHVWKKGDFNEQVCTTICYSLMSKTSEFPINMVLKSNFVLGMQKLSGHCSEGEIQ